MDRSLSTILGAQCHFRLPRIIHWTNRLRTFSSLATKEYSLAVVVWPSLTTRARYMPNRKNVANNPVVVLVSSRSSTVVTNFATDQVQHSLFLHLCHYAVCGRAQTACSRLTEQKRRQHCLPRLPGILFAMTRGCLLVCSQDSGPLPVYEEPDWKRKL